MTALWDELCRARLVDLEQLRFAGQPGLDQHGPGLAFLLHRRHEGGTGRRTSSTGLVVCSDHAGTHIDALCHQALDLELHGQVAVTAETQTPTGFTTHGADAIAPVICPGVLLDVAAACGPLAPRATIGVDELQRAAARLARPPARGAAILVRTGYGAHWDEPERYLDAPGIDRAGSEWIAALGPRAVGIDNARWDELGVTDPECGYRNPGHALFLVRDGTHIVENLALEELAALAPEEFVFICTPLKLQGATGAPARPLALIAGTAG